MSKPTNLTARFEPTRHVTEALVLVVALVVVAATFAITSDLIIGVAGGAAVYAVGIRIAKERRRTTDRASSLRTTGRGRR